MKYLWIIPLAIFVAAGAFLFLRQVYLRWATKDSNYGGVQRLDKKIPKKPQGDFLPGSQTYQTAESQATATQPDPGKKETQKPHSPKKGLFLPGSQSYQPAEVIVPELDRRKRKARKAHSKKRGLLFSRDEIRRSYILDALLDKPKWQEDEHQPH